ncbi:hypothetical protein Tco_0849206 [Tanacetum coccineum]
MFVVCACARYQVNPKVSHLHAVKRIFRYLKGQPKLGLWYLKDSPFDLVAYTDSDYAGASLDRKSTTGGFQFLGCRLISWQCMKQTVVANSTTEAKYVAASSCRGQVLWIQNQLLDYGYNFMHTKIFIDNNRKAKKSVRLMMEKFFGIELELMLVKTVNGEVLLHTLLDGKKIIVTKSTVRRDLQLEDAEELGEGSAMPIDLHHIPTITQPSTSQPQKTQKPRKPKRKDTQVPQPSGPTNIIVDEAVHKELSDSLVRAATTASSLEVECQETIRDTIAQTRFENESKHSNDSLLARGNTLQSDKDSLKLKEFIELCTNLQQRVLDLEKTKTTQQNKIASLKRKVKKLEQKKRSRTHGLKWLHNVDEDITLVNVQDDADNEMFDVDTLTGDEVITEQEVAAKDVNLTIDEVTLAKALAALKSVKPKVKGDVIEEPSIPVSVVSASIKVSVVSASTKVSAATTTTATIPTPRKGIVITELGTPTITRSSQQPSQAEVQDKGKGKMIEPEPVKPKKKDVQIMLDEEAAKKLQAEFDKEERLAREKENEANIALTEEWDDIHAKIEADHELTQRLQAEEQEELSVEEKATLFQQLLEKRRKHFAAKRAEEQRNKPPTQAQQRKIMCTYLKNMEGNKLKDLKNKSFDSIQKMFDRAFKRQKVDEDKDIEELQSLMEVIPDEEEVTIDVVPLAIKSPSIVGWKIHKEGKKSYYQIMRADGKSQIYRVFSLMLKSFSKEDLEDLYKLVKAKYKSTRPVEDLDFVLWSDLKTMFEPMIELKFGSCNKEKRYPLTPPIITDMLNKKLQGMIVGIKSLLNVVSIIVALINVNDAQSKLVLLENFNENYSKCLRLLVKLQLPVQSYYCYRKLLLLVEVKTAQRLRIKIAK